MRKLLLILAFMLAGLTASAQGEVKNGAWEDKRVVEVPETSTSTLYLRALEALSDWAGSQEKSKMGIDVQDKEQGLVVYKGEYYLGYGKTNFMAGWDTWANFTLKIRCKDGRAQVSVTVPSLTFRFTGQPAETTAPIDQFLPEYRYRTKYTNKRAARELSPKVPTEFESIIAAMCERLSKGSEDDDF
jgi:hypothetical protein